MAIAQVRWPTPVYTSPAPTVPEADLAWLASLLPATEDDEAGSWTPGIGGAFAVRTLSCDDHARTFRAACAGVRDRLHAAVRRHSHGFLAALAAHPFMTRSLLPLLRSACTCFERLFVRATSGLSKDARQVELGSTCRHRRSANSRARARGSQGWYCP